MEEAEALLGHPFGYTLEVCHEENWGRTIGVPTMNQHLPEGLVQPKFGVYASLISLEKATIMGLPMWGLNLTVGSDCVVSETWIPCFHGISYMVKWWMSICLNSCGQKGNFRVWKPYGE